MTQQTLEMKPDCDFNNEEKIYCNCIHQQLKWSRPVSVRECVCVWGGGGF